MLPAVLLSGTVAAIAGDAQQLLIACNGGMASSILQGDNNISSSQRAILLI